MANTLITQTTLRDPSMDYVETEPSAEDESPTQIMLYHPDMAPTGHAFFTDDLPAGAAVDEDGNFDFEGWVDTPAKFPGYEAPRTFTSPLSRLGVAKRDPEPPKETFRYHGKYGAQRFFMNDLPTDPGWFDNPPEARNWWEARNKAEPKAEIPKAVEVLPANFPDLNSFMTAYVGKAITDDMSPVEKGSIKKDGIEMYGIEKFGVNIDKRQTLNACLSEVANLEFDQARESAKAS